MITLFHYDDEKEDHALRAVEKLQNDLIKTLDAHRYGILLFDPDGELVAVNQQWQRLYMLSYKEMQGYNILNDTALHPKHIWASIKGAFQGTAGIIEENYFSPAEWGKQGRSRWTEGHCLPIPCNAKDEDELLGAVVILNDITDIKQSQYEVERLRQMLSELHAWQSDILRQTPSTETSRRQYNGGRPKSMPEVQQIITAASNIPRREREIFELLAAGHSVKEAAHMLDLATKSVYTYRARLMQRLKLQSSVELAVAWREIQEASDE